MRTYADASVEALNVRCMPRAEFLQKMRELVQENALTLGARMHVSRVYMVITL